MATANSMRSSKRGDSGGQFGGERIGKGRLHGCGHTQPNKNALPREGIFLPGSSRSALIPHNIEVG